MRFWTVSLFVVGRRGKAAKVEEYNCEMEPKKVEKWRKEQRVPRKLPGAGGGRWLSRRRKWRKNLVDKKETRT